MPEPRYLIELSGDDLTMWKAVKPLDATTEHVVPSDGSIMIRSAATGEIVGKRVRDWTGWNEDKLGETFGYAFGYGFAGPIMAIRQAKARQHCRHSDPDNSGLCIYCGLVLDPD